MRIGLTYDLRDDYLAEGYGEEETAEFDQPSTIDALDGALASLGHRVERIGNVRALTRALAAGRRWDLVFNIAEGLEGFGREAQVPALLEAHGIPCTFSDTLVMSVCLHKGMTKDVLRSAGVATPDFRLVKQPADIADVRLPYPLFAKPVAEGTGKGITATSKIENAAQLDKVCRRLLRNYKQPVLVERFLPGREFTVGIIGSGRKAKALATVEILLLAGADEDVYSYRNKEYCEELVHYQLLANSKLRREIEALAVRAWRVLGCRDAGRVDLRLDENGMPNVLEINPLAGIHPEHSDLPIMATQVGVSYKELIRRIMASALARCESLQPAREQVAVA